MIPSTLKRIADRPAATMKLVGGRVCLDFVNTVSGWLITVGPNGDEIDSMTILRDKLVEFDDLIAWGRHANLLTDAEVDALIAEAAGDESSANAVLIRAKSLRGAIHRICRSVVYGTERADGDLELMNSEIAIARAHQRLVANEDGFAWSWEDGVRIDRVLW